MAGGKLSGKDLGLFILRVALGVIFIWHGLTKVWGEKAPGINALADMLGNLGVPAPRPMAFALLASEIGGGMLLILGFLAQLGAGAIAVTMLVAIIKVHLHDSFLFSPEKQADNTLLWRWGLELNVAYLAMALCILFTGPGHIGLIPKRKGGGKPPGGI
jgi:putative oxidoreductase